MVQWNTADLTLAAAPAPPLLACGYENGAVVVVSVAATDVRAIVTGERGKQNKIVKNKKQNKIVNNDYDDIATDDNGGGGDNYSDEVHGSVKELGKFATTAATATIAATTAATTAAATAVTIVAAAAAAANIALNECAFQALPAAALRAAGRQLKAQQVRSATTCN
jgi:hypothetical protein